jgi:hypothetical protein
VGGKRFVGREASTRIQDDRQIRFGAYFTKYAINGISEITGTDLVVPAEMPAHDETIPTTEVLMPTTSAML